MTPRPDEVAVRRVGDDVVPDADVVMDRAFSEAPPTGEVWPWFVQLGKRRAGWYLPRRVERLRPAEPTGDACRREPSRQG